MECPAAPQMQVLLLLLFLFIPMAQVIYIHYLHVHSAIKHLGVKAESHSVDLNFHFTLVLTLPQVLLAHLCQLLRVVISSFIILR